MSAKLHLWDGLGLGERWGRRFWGEEPVVTADHRDALDDINGI